MNDYILRLVSRLSQDERPLSRNRHFHTFENPDGKKALRISRHLRALAHDIIEQARRGEPLRVSCVTEDSTMRVQLEFVRLKARRTAYLSPAEFKLLLQSAPVREAISTARRAA